MSCFSDFEKLDLKNPEVISLLLFVCLSLCYKLANVASEMTHRAVLKG